MVSTEQKPARRSPNELEFAKMKSVSAEEAVAMIPNGATVMVGGFMGVGTPERLVDELVRQKKSELTVICNDAGLPGKGVGKLFDAKLVSTLTASHIGLNPNAQQQMMAKQIAVDLVPQGTLVERIRAGGCGLGGVLTQPESGQSSRRASSICSSMGRPSCSRPRCARISRLSMRLLPITSAT